MSMEPRARQPRPDRVTRWGVRRPILLATASLVLLAACSAVGSRPGPAGASAVVPTAQPSVTAPASIAASGRPSATPPTSVAPSGVIDTAEEALAAVVAKHPRFKGYPLLGVPSEEDGSPGPIMGGGGGVIGARTWAVASEHDSGIALTFMTGSGDCPAGCIHVRAETYLVAPDGTVTFLCAEDDPEAERSGRAIVPSEPCASPEG